ncbi:hypothetical protein [Aeromicrobium erythreum]|uniref:AbiTii domain-containing protein n=1 Tax=Aeromicrobium erythreum TaxID=2041 RepID=A0A0U4CNQ2_9ACTN|nr:hypothetical protein [Aeromicrobium erythreum]ALX04300.1 hypothetical protein AERYTH_06125 [Aeromicrobium erythreum]
MLTGSPERRTVSLSDSLRKLLIVARRINSDHLSRFVRSELNGYDAEATLPEARVPAGLKVSVRFDGPGGAVDYVHVGQLELPKPLAGVLSDNGFREPLAELEALANNDADSDPRLELPYYWVHLYREHAAKNEVPHIKFMVANRAFIRMPRTILQGVLDRVRTQALDLSLDIEQVAADAGEPSGPTVQDKPELAEVVDRYILVNAAAGSTVTIGNDATVASGLRPSV